MQSFNNFLVNNYSLIKAFHVISMVAWMAALLYLPRLFVYHTTVKKNSESSEMLKIMEYRLEKFIMNPAMLLTILFGMLLLKMNGIVNWNEKWIYFKLSAVVLFVFSVQVSAQSSCSSLVLNEIMKGVGGRQSSPSKEAAR